MTDLSLHVEKVIAGWVKVWPHKQNVTGEHAQNYVANIRKRKDGWHAEIYDINKEAIIQFAGIWKSQKDAVEEARSVLKRIIYIYD